MNELVDELMSWRSKFTALGMRSDSTFINFFVINFKYFVKYCSQLAGMVKEGKIAKAGKD